LGRKLKVFSACILFGAAYGGFFGAICGGIIWNNEVSLLAAVTGGLYGIVLGALGGAASGFIGNLVGGRVGWCIAGVAGGTFPAALLGFFIVAGGLWGPDGHQGIRWTWLLPSLVVVLIGSFLGLALGSGLRRGMSVVPGVQQLAAIINDGHSLARTAKPRDASTEMLPASTPEGRGDELAPAEVVFPPGCPMERGRR
jgi:MFS family permease